MHVLTKPSLFALAFAPSCNFVASAQPFSSSFSSSMFGGGNGVNFAEREGRVKCRVILIEPLMVEPDAKERSTVACMLYPEYEGDSISGITYELYTPSFPHGFFEDVDYSTTDLTISAALVKTAGAGREHGGGVIVLKNGATATKELHGKGMGLRGGSSRRLAPTVGNSSLIVLYAVPLDASNSDRTPTQLANDVFGMAVNETQDPVNARSQVLSCSGGKLSYIPACGTSGQSCSSNVNQSIWFKNGVLRVPIPYNVTGIASGTVKNWVEAEAQKILQAQTPQINLYSFTQIMNVIPDEADWGGAAAWAYLPGQTSAFRNSYSWRMGVQVHEFGHNIGLHHSGNGTAEYADHSCLLGNPSYEDDGPEICFNGAKSWETGWYATDSVDVVPSSTVPFTADLIGAADWSTGTYTPGSHRVVLRITDSTVTQKYHIMYNRAKGPNAGVTFAKDKVTVTLGAPQQVSWHQAALGPVNAAGNVYPVFRKEKFNGGNKVSKACENDSLQVFLQSLP
ncbi:hypothetical protein ACHAW5_007501 [Stephanodiscus triporus]|uniref:Peptidase M11 gametolysin domain-containing protein n=1 Tax=Stephanodiscus triporus TaxID=2934178 RepID=A0ABD3P6P8_9STRA